MHKYQLIHKKRKPVFRISGFVLVISIAIVIIIGIFFEDYSDQLLIRNIILGILFFIIISCVFIRGNPIFIKDVIGNVSFYSDLIYLKIHDHEEKIYLSDIMKITFLLDGYKGLNKNPPTSIFFTLSSLKTQTGLNNFLHFTQLKGSNRTIEFFIPNKSAWISINEIANQYYMIINK